MHRTILRIIFVAVIVLAAWSGKVPSSASAQNTASSNLVAVTSSVAPSYPVIVRGTLGVVDVSDEVMVEVQVDGNGAVTSARALSGHPLLRVPAVKAARRWTFAHCDPCRVERTIRLTFIFRTMPRGTPEEELTPVFSSPYQVEVRRVSVKAKPNNGMQRTRN